MITAAQLNSKLTELGVEFHKVADADNATEAMQWIVNTADFLRELLEEAEMMRSLSEYERATVREIETVVSGRGFEMKHVLLARIRKGKMK